MQTMTNTISLSHVFHNKGAFVPLYLLTYLLAWNTISMIALDLTTNIAQYSKQSQAPCEGRFVF